MSDNKKRILLIFGLLLILIIITIIKKFTYKNTSNTISFNEIVVQNEEISNTSTNVEKIKVHITGEVNQPRIN